MNHDQYTSLQRRLRDSEFPWAIKKKERERNICWSSKQLSPQVSPGSQRPPPRAGPLPHLQLPCWALVTVPARSPASMMTAGSFQTGKEVVTQTPLLCPPCRKPSLSPREATEFPSGGGGKRGLGNPTVGHRRGPQASRRRESRAAGSSH